MNILHFLRFSCTLKTCKFGKLVAMGASIKYVRTQGGLGGGGHGKCIQMSTRKLGVGEGLEPFWHTHYVRTCKNSWG